jgi:hypothetical protein
MTNAEIEDRLAKLVGRERAITQETLELICEAERRKLYLDRGYSSLFDWLVSSFRYSQSAAYRRVQAARLLMELPEIRELLVQGDLNLSSLSRLEGAVKRMEKRSGKKVDPELKRELVQQIRGKSGEETEKILRHSFQEIDLVRDSLAVAGPEHYRLTVTLEDETVLLLKRVRELLSHSCEGWQEIVSYLAADFLKRKDPLRRR